MPIRKRPSPPKKGKRVSSIKECKQRNKRQVPAGNVGVEIRMLHYRQLRSLWSEILQCCKLEFLEAYVANTASLNFFVYKSAWASIAKERAMWIFVKV
ncbi:hypothetical protein CDA61_14350 [Alcaligenes faecalis]|nr:hypothetical protein CDA61_14350 [Alcaligenes faecalis]